MPVAFSQAPDSASTLRVFTTRAIATVLNEIGDDFEKASGYRLVLTTDIAIRLVRRIEAENTFDVLVATPEQIDALVKEGKIVGETRALLARSGIGVAVRSGAGKPDISSVETFKTALLNAKSIAFLKEGQSGLYLDTLIAKLGLTEALASKITRPELDVVCKLVASGEVELGLVVITQIVTSRGVQLVGPLPPEIQWHAKFAAGASSKSQAPGAAECLIKFLSSSRATAVMKSQGMER